MNIKQALLKTAEIVRQGWCQKAAAKDEQGDVLFAFDGKACSHCMIGALMVATKGEPELIGPAISAMLGSPLCPRDDKGKKKGLMSWNDEPGRTPEEVVAFVEGVAAEQP